MPQQVSNSFFENLASVKINSFYKSTGEINYKEIPIFLQLTSDDMAKIAKISVKTVRYDEKMPTVLKERVEEIKNICELVYEMLGDVSKTQLWFRTKNQMLGNNTPRDLIRFGRYQKILDILIDIKRGNMP